MAADKSSQLPFGKRLLLGGVSLVLATAVWLPVMHLAFAESVSQYFADDGVPPKARMLADRHLHLWTDPASRNREIERMRASNAEWDFMGRSFLVWSLAEMALRDPGLKPRCLETMDRIIDETLRLEREEGLYFFLMPYARGGSWRMQPPRSQFIDGEIALMLACRRMVEEKASYKPLLAERVHLMVERMNRSPVLSAESYPDECWTFCNIIALTSMHLADLLDGTDHSAFIRRWIETAKKRLTHRETGLLVSSYTVDGQHLDGPEGSTIWMVAHCLSLFDEEYAADQYARARRELGRSVLGFGYAREWPESWPGPIDVDSGPTIPILEANAGSSGNAFIAAASFKDHQYLGRLLTSLNAGAFPVTEDGRLRYLAANQVGEAAMLYSMMLGPVWDKARWTKTEAAR